MPMPTVSIASCGPGTCSAISGTLLFCDKRGRAPLCSTSCQYMYVVHVACIHPPTASVFCCVGPLYAYTI